MFRFFAFALGGVAAFLFVSCVQSAWTPAAVIATDKLKAEAVQAGAAEWTTDPKTGGLEFVWIDGQSLRDASETR